MRETDVQFVKIPRFIECNREFSPMEKTVYGVIRSFGTEGVPDSCFPSRRAVALNVPCSMSTVGRAIKTLCSVGLMSYVRGRKGRANTYHFHDKKCLAPGITSDAIPVSSTTLPTTITDTRISSPMVAQPESFTQNHKPEKSPRLFYGRDQAYIENNEDVTIKLDTGERVPWSNHHVEDFHFGNLHGEKALQAAKKQYIVRPSSSPRKSGTVSLLPTNGESSDQSSSPTLPLDNIKNG